MGRANPRLVPFIGVNARFMSPDEIRAEILDAYTECLRAAQGDRKP